MCKALMINYLLFLFHLAATAQDSISQLVLRQFKFEEHCIVANQDTIYFYVHAKGNMSKNSLVLFLSGSTPDPLFTYEMKDGKMESYFWGHQDYKQLADNDVFVVIAKKGMHGVWNEGELKSRNLSGYLEKNSLDYRVWQADEVIKYCLKKIVKKPKRLIVYGHSEGFNVAAKLLTKNKHITHAGLWAGTALSDYYDFIISERGRQLKGEISDTLFVNYTDTLLTEFEAIMKSPNAVDFNSTYTNKRWASYAEPSLYHLLKTDVPIYMVAATADESAPIESTYIVPLEFTRLGKKNLHFSTCVGCDHSFATTAPDGRQTSHWTAIFNDFLRWTEHNN